MMKRKHAYNPNHSSPDAARAASRAGHTTLPHKAAATESTTDTAALAKTAPATQEHAAAPALLTVGRLAPEAPAASSISGKALFPSSLPHTTTGYSATPHPHRTRASASVGTHARTTPTSPMVTIGTNTENARIPVLTGACRNAPRRVAASARTPATVDGRVKRTTGYTRASNAISCMNGSSDPASAMAGSSMAARRR